MIDPFRNLDGRKSLALIICVSLIVTVGFGVLRGQDFNWDQRNYHIGVAHLLYQDRFWSSVTPAGVQSYFNPYLHQIQYFGIRHLPPIVFGILLSVVQSLGFILAGVACLIIARSPAHGFEQREKNLLGLLGFALCMLAPIALSMAGTTFIDLVTAVPIIAAYTLLLARDQVGLMRAAVFAGLLIGMATALKLTNGVFAFGVLGFALAGTDSWRQRLWWLLLGAFAVFTAFLAVGGAWQLELWQRFQNPFFPFFNNLFHSPDVPAMAGRDTRFLPQSILDIWRFPLYWVTGGSPVESIAAPSSELPIGDARWIFVTFEAVPLLAGLAWTRDWRKRWLADPASGLVFAVLIAYLLWLGLFGIHRYMVVIEILCGAALLVLAIQFSRRLVRIGLLTGLTLVSLGIIEVPNWGRAPWNAQWYGINAQPLDVKGPTIAFLTGVPTFYLAASFPANVRFVGLTGAFDFSAEADTSLARQLKQELSDPPGTRIIVIDQGSQPEFVTQTLRSHGLIATTRCQNFMVSQEAFRLCDVEQIGN
jgi:hypothetical protein